MFGGAHVYAQMSCEIFYFRRMIYVWFASIIVYYVFGVSQVQCRLVNYIGVKGNQVRVLSDPVTVSGENDCICHCAARHEKAQSAEEPQVRKPAEDIFAQLPMKAWCDMGLQGFVCRRDNGLIVRLLLDEAGVFLLL